MALSEFELIREFFARPASLQAASRTDILLGIGDDAALLSPSPGLDMAVAVDTLVNGVHFPTDLSAGHIAYRSLAVNLSDLAAMGAKPRWFTLSLTLPDAEASWLRDFAEALFALAKEHDVALVGGDTTRGPLSVSIQVIGESERGKALRRDGAKVGDRVLVSGVPGLAALGLQRWQEGIRSGAAIERFLMPAPRVALGQALRGLATAAIDVSDGLWADLGHILSASGVGARLDLDQLPADVELPVTGASERQNLSLYGGDDYELCFTVAHKHRQLAVQRAAELGIPIREIGQIVSGSGIEAPGLEDPSATATAVGYRHF